MRGDHAADAAIGEVLHVVHRRHVGHARARDRLEQAATTIGTTRALPLTDDLGELQHRLLAIAEHGRVEEVRDGLRVERGVTSGDDDRMRLITVRGDERDAGEVQCREHVGVAELGRERQAEKVECPDRTVRVDGELRDAVLAHEGLEVGPYGVRALAEHAGLLIEHLVENLDALVGGPDLVGIGVHQRPVDISLVPLGRDGVHLAADVLNGLLDQGEQRLQGREDRVGGTRCGRGRRHGRRHGRRVPAVVPGRGSELLLLVQAHVLQQAQGDPRREHRRAAV